jgi:hypothetical protein
MVMVMSLPFNQTCLVAGLGGRVVTSIAASKYLRALATEDGQVWTFGGCFNEALGHA